MVITEGKVLWWVDVQNETRIEPTGSGWQPFHAITSRWSVNPRQSPEATLLAHSLLRFPCVVLFAEDIRMVFR